MKAKFKIFYNLSAVLMMCGLMFFIYTGCGGSEDEAEEFAAASAFGYIPPGLNPPNGAAYDDVFFKEYGTNPFIDTEDDHLSTFGMDVDTASYSITRRYLRDGHLPPTEAVRVEEFVNAFDYNYVPPSQDAFAVHIEGAPSRFGEGKRLAIVANRYPRPRCSRRKS